MKGSARADGKNSVRGLSAGVPAPKGTVRRNESKRVVTSSHRATPVFRNEKKSSFKKVLSSFAAVSRAKNDARLLSFTRSSRDGRTRSSACLASPGFAGAAPLCRRRARSSPTFPRRSAASGATAAARFLALALQPAVVVERRHRSAQLSEVRGARDVGVFSTAFTRWFQVDRPSLSVKISCGCSASQKKGEFHHSHDNTQYVPRSARQDVAPFASHLASRER